MTTSSEFLVAVRRAAAVPDSTVPGDMDIDLLGYGDEEIQGRMLSLVMANRDEFFVCQQDFAVTSGISKYQIPFRSIGGKLRDVLLLVNGQYIKLTRMDPQELTDYSATQPGQPTRFYMENAHVVLFPTPNVACTLRMKYFTRPGHLVTTASAVFSYQVTISNGIADFTIATAAQDQNYDVISALNPYPLMIADTVQDVPTVFPDYTCIFTGESQYFANSQSNWLCDSGDSCVIQLPDELVPTLIQRVAARYLEAKGQLNDAKTCEARAERLEASALILLSPRTDGNPKRIGSGPLWKSGYWYGNGWWR